MKTQKCEICEKELKEKEQIKIIIGNNKRPCLIFCSYECLSIKAGELSQYEE